MKLLSGCQKGAPVTALVNVIRAAVAPTLTFGFQAWWSLTPQRRTPKTGIQHMDVVMRRAARAALPLYRTTPAHLVMHAAGVPPMALVLDDLTHAGAIRLSRLDPRHMLRLPENRRDRVESIRQTLPRRIPECGHDGLPTSFHRDLVQAVIPAASKEEQAALHRQAVATSRADDLQ